jgi:hypothetical protein
MEPSVGGAVIPIKGTKNIVILFRVMVMMCALDKLVVAEV